MEPEDIIEEPTDEELRAQRAKNVKTYFEAKKKGETPVMKQNVRSSWPCKRLEMDLESYEESLAVMRDRIVGLIGDGILSFAGAEDGLL